MAKKDSKKKAKKDGPGVPQDAVEAVRAAVERTFHASAESAQSTRERTRELMDEVAAAAARVRQAFDDLRLLEDLKGLRAEVDALARRVAALEGTAPAEAGAAKPASTRAGKSTGRTSAAKSSTGRSRTAAKSSGTSKPRTGKRASSRSTGSQGRSTGT
jgi:hypothetical protein